MPTLSENDPEPAGRSGPPVWFVALIVVVVFALVVLHLTGVVGPG
jgi:antibiotic biosynthesis monooxygenase (ABM) superfamily enzyme